MIVTSQDRLNLPWTTEGKENKRFTRILSLFIVILLVLSIWIPSILLPVKDRKALEKLPPQLAKLIKKKTPLKLKPKSIKKEEPIIKKDVKKKPKPEKKVKPKVEKPKPKLRQPTLLKPKAVKKANLSKKIKEARKVAKKSGLLALQSDLASLKTIVNVSALKKRITPRKEQIIAAKASAINTGNIIRSSGGIKTTGLSAPAETIKLSGQESLMLIATDDEIALAKAEADAALKINSRSEESIRLVAESLKKPLKTLYLRAVRKNPFLEGLLVLELVIEPEGEVSSCTLVSSELKDDRFVKKVINRVLLADFGAENVAQTRIHIPFPFAVK